MKRLQGWHRFGSTFFLSEPLDPNQMLYGLIQVAHWQTRFVVAYSLAATKKHFFCFAWVISLHIVACQRGGVSVKPPDLRATTRHGLLTFYSMNRWKRAFVTHTRLYVLTDSYHAYCSTCIQTNGPSKIKRRCQYWTYFN